MVFYYSADFYFDYAEAYFGYYGDLAYSVLVDLSLVFHQIFSHLADCVVLALVFADVEVLADYAADFAGAMVGCRAIHCFYCLDFCFLDDFVVDDHFLVHVGRFVG